MGGATGYVRGGAEMRCARLLDRLGLSLPVWSAQADREQQPLLDPAPVAPAEYRLTGIVADRASGCVRLAGTLRSFVTTAGDLCRSPALPWRVYRAANWIELGLTRANRRTREGYSDKADAPKRVFVRPLCRDPRARLTHPERNRFQLAGAPKIMLNAQQMRALPLCFTLIADPRRAQGRVHRLPVVLGIAAGAILCGMRGYKAISDWAPASGQKARMRFGCRRESGRHFVPSEFVIRDCLIRIEPGALDRAPGALSLHRQGQPTWSATRYRVAV